MKQFLFPIFLFTLLASSLSLHAQDKAFKEGDFVIDAGANFAYYNNTSTPNSGPGAGVPKNDKMAGGVYAAGLEYGLFNWLGIGIKVRYDDYITSKDSITHLRPSVTGYDVLVNANLHVIKTKHLDIPIGLGYGYSGIQYNVPQDTLARNLKGQGAIFDVHMDPRLYFGEHFGINFHVAYTYFGYPSVIYNDNKNGTSVNTTHLTATGLNLGIGLQIKF
jgi:hypothetical protein